VLYGQAALGWYLDRDRTGSGRHGQHKGRQQDCGA